MADNILESSVRKEVNRKG